MKVAYPYSHHFEQLDSSQLSLKIARHSPCSLCRDCSGLHPPPGVSVVPDRPDDSGLDLGHYGSDDEDEEVSSFLSECACGHGVAEHNANEAELGRSEFTRRARVAVRLDELLMDSGRLLDFDYTDDDILSLQKQMGHPKSSVTVVSSTQAPASSPPTRNPQSQVQSRDSSVLSEIPQPQKKRRVSLSSLSDAEDNDDDDEDEDEEEDKPLAARIMVGARSIPPAKRSGKQPPGKEGEEGQHSNGDNEERVPNGRTNGVNGHESRVKIEDRMDDGQLNRLTAGVAVDASGRSSTGPPLRTEKPSTIELRKGLIQIVPVENDRQPRSLVILTGLKTLFQKQLPKMPREYIARLVYDENSKSLAIIKRGFKVCFFATNSADQEKGYGGMLMDHYKAHIRKTYPDMWHFLTYADNYAVGYFEKQGFSKDITLEQSIWGGYIKDYEGGTIMQCTMIPKVDYLNKFSLFKIQQEAVMKKIRELSKSHIVHPGLPQFQPGMPFNPVDARDVPGLRESGWTPELAASMSRANGKNPSKFLMEQITKELVTEPKCWAFLKPVDPTDVGDYYEVIKNPIDFETIQHKIETNKYKTFDSFVEDVQLVWDNCRQYNPEQTIYAKNAKHMETVFKKLLAQHLKKDS